MFLSFLQQTQVAVLVGWAQSGIMYAVSQSASSPYTTVGESVPPLPTPLLVSQSLLSLHHC